MKKKLYRRVKLSFDTDRNRDAIEILDSIAPYWRSRYVAEAIVAYSKSKIQNGQASNRNRDIDLDPKSQPVSKHHEDFFE
jgi:anti-sigma-K factor RskA